MKAGKTFTFVIDNIDWTVNVHEMCSDSQNKSLHAMTTTLAFDRVLTDDKPDDKPKQSLFTCNIVKIVTLTEEKVKNRRYRYKIFAARILCKFVPEFSLLKELTPAHSPFLYF